MYTAPFVALISIFVVTVSAFQRPEGGPDGIYVHSVDNDGNELVKYVGPSNATSLDTAVRARAIPVKARAGSGPQCQGSRMDAGDVSNAVAGLAAYFGGGTTFYSKSVSSYSGSAVAYGCNYGNGQTVTSGQFTGYENALSSVCGDNAEAYYNLPDWKASYGRTASSDGFC